MTMADPYEDERREAAADIQAQNRRRICNECSHVWASTDPGDDITLPLQPCPECGSTDSIRESDLLADQADRRV